VSSVPRPGKSDNSTREGREVRDMPPRPFNRQSREQALDKMFQTRSHAWEQVGLARQLSAQAAKRARRDAILVLPLLAGVIFAYSKRDEFFGAGTDTVVRVITVVALLILGWAFARAVGRAAGPTFFRRMDPATSGTVGFLIRLVFIAVTLLGALRIAGLPPETVALGGTVGAIVIGLAAQQTLGNVFAGLVLLSARPFRVGERVRFQSGGLAGQTEGVVSSLGLLYVTLSSGEDRIMLPNSVALNSAVIPLLEPDAVNMRARLPRGMKPSDLQRALEDALTVPTRDAPHIELEEFDGDEVIVRILATPEKPTDGRGLADEVLAAVDKVSIDPASARPLQPNGNGEGVER
jgi:small-conductance mechanosensitive channel